MKNRWKIMKISKFVLLSCLSLSYFATTGKADQYHYSNILIGDRAIGLGGAYTGIADDASGVYYNPAGLGFALSNDVSGSANALYSRKITYKKTIGNDDFHEKSSGTLPSFFGGLQKLDHLAKGLVFAFGMYTTDSELKDQNDLIQGANLGTPSACIKVNDAGQPIDASGNATTDSSQFQRGGSRPPLILERFHRTVNQRGSSFYIAGALGYRVSSKTSLGFGLNYVTIDELVQEYQDVRTKETLCRKDGSYLNSTSQKGQNIRQRLLAYGLQPVFGIQTAFFDRFSLGLTIKMGIFASQTFEQEAEIRATGLEADDQAKVDANPFSQISTVSSAFINQLATNNKTDKPLGKSMPSEYRLGLAYFASTRLLIAYDLIYISAVDPGTVEGAGDLYKRESVLNHAVGMEYYLIPAIPLRIGAFTNNDARPTVQEGGMGQPDHIDYLGFTLFLAWVQPNSQIGAGVVLQEGKGKAQKVGPPSKDIQTVEASSFTFAFSATHSF